MGDMLSTLKTGTTERSGPLHASEITAETPQELLRKLEDVAMKGTAEFRRAAEVWSDTAGDALLRIHDERLYELDGFRTWTDYLRERFGDWVAGAYRQMDYVKVQRALAPGGMELDNESHSRVLAKVLRKHGSETVRHLYARAAEATDGKKRTASKLEQMAVDLKLIEPKSRDDVSPNWREKIITESGEPVYSVTSVGDTSTKQDVPPMFSTITHEPAPPAAPRPVANPFTAPAEEVPEPLVIRELRHVLDAATQACTRWDGVKQRAMAEHPAGTRDEVLNIIMTAQYLVNEGNDVVKYLDERG